MQQPYSKNSFHGAAAGRGREKAMGLPVSRVDELQPCALQGNVPLEPAAIFAVSVKRVLPGGKLHPDLMCPPGVERDLRKAQGTVRCRLYDAVFQNGFPHPLRGRFTGKTRPFRLSLNR